MTECERIHVEGLGKLMILNASVCYSVSVNKSTTFALRYMVDAHEFGGIGFFLISHACLTSTYAKALSHFVFVR